MRYELTAEGFFNENKEVVWFWNTNKQKLLANAKEATELMINYIDRIGEKNRAKIIKSLKKYVTFKFESNSEHGICNSSINVSFTDKIPGRIVGNYTFFVEDVKAAITAIECDYRL